MTRIPVLMCIDVEPDERLIDPNVRKAWRGFEITYEFFSELRLRLQAATGSPVHFCWFLRMDPQIARTYGSASWAVTRYPLLIEELKRAGDALGSHTHAWRWNDASNEWILDLADQEWVDQCVRMGLRSFNESLNESCLYFRFGDRWMSNATFDLVEKLGVRFDMTLEPGQEGGQLEEPSTGSLLDYGHVPQYPYRPSRREFRIPGSVFKRRLWAIPLSAGSKNWSPEPFSPLDSRIISKEVTSREEPSCQIGFDSSVETVNGIHEGYLDTVDAAYISGWVYDKSKPDAPLDVEVYDGDVLLTRARAATFRPDLLAAGKGDGKHSFNVPVPSWMKDGKPRLIQVKVAATGFYLDNSPKELTCNEMSGSEQYMTLNLSFDTWPVCRIIDRLLNGKKNRYLAMVVRSDVCIHADQYSNMQESFDHILRHPLIGQLAFITPDKIIKGR